MEYQWTQQNLIHFKDICVNIWRHFSVSYFSLFLLTNQGLLKDLSKHKGATHAEEDNGEHQKNDVSASVKHLIDVTFVKLIQCITAPVLDEDLFVEYLRSIGSTMREVANVVDEEHAKKLVEITKNLMQKGLQYRQGAPSNELVSALKHLITLLKEVTD